MGTVYEAQDLGLGRGVAVKFLQPRVAHDFGLVERFMREAKATAAIAHPRIVDVFDVGWTDDGQLPYFVMELLDGKNLTSELRASGTMSVDRAVGIVVQVLDALEAAHGKGFIHRDLKPENIFVIRHGLEEDVKVLDFGITKSIGGGVDNASLTHTGAVLGTPAYMSPEQARGSREIDHRTDLYAAGAILFELITGRPPYEGETYNEIIIKIATEEPPPIQSLRPGVHPALAGVIHKALARDPERRWPSCAAMVQALHEVLDNVHTSTGILADDLGEPTNSTLKPTPTAWEVTAPAPVPRGSRPVRPREESEQIDSDPDERTKAIASKIGTPSGGVQPWKVGPVIRVGAEGAPAALLAHAEETSSLPVTESLHEDTSSLPIPEDTGSLPMPDLSAMTGSFSALAPGSRTRTFAILAVVGLLTGAGTYLIGGWILDGDPSRPDIEETSPLVEARAAHESIGPRPEPPIPPFVGSVGGAETPPPSPPVAPPPVVPPAPPAPECRVRATVATPHATVSLDGSRAGAEIDLPSACGSTHLLEVSAPGHAPERLELTAREAPEPWRVELEELAAPPRPAPPPRAPGPRRIKRSPRLEPNPF